jgi:cytochrome b561
MIHLLMVLMHQFFQRRRGLRCLVQLADFTIH